MINCTYNQEGRKEGGKVILIRDGLVGESMEIVLSFSLFLFFSLGGGWKKRGKGDGGCRNFGHFPLVLELVT